MPFGLNGTASSFQTVMDKALKGLQDCAVAYIDDILVFSPSWEAYLQHLRQALEALRHVALTANLKKSHLGHTWVQFLAGPS